ncbi:MAG: TraB/GumN family protein [Bacteroidales bacterium]|nr:TraB/GumN family protein [Bacteroidales bacterium]MCF8344514.1 TraB/GumN family protein [Bacteroidales bacterium]MCF8350776.1 TraB/GumN family protein [Bacteroidales bacterium]MCF8376857.1 TraB/GumN family protein [Bacteroidales bacterium]MCF8401872.1 TraB/GumN family protein [Bacteroidales bacterium]
MKRTIKLVLLLCCMLAIFPMQQLSAQNSPNNSLLYGISGNGLKEPSYLFGTVHLLCPDQLEISENVTNAIQQSEVLVLEVNMSIPDFLSRAQKLMYMKEGLTLDSLFNEEEYETLNHYFKDSIQMPLFMFRRVKPFFVMSFTLIGFMDCKPASYEEALLKIAKQNDLEVIGIETVEEQMGIIDEIELEMQADMLLESISKYDSTRMMYNEMMRLYLSGDIDGIFMLTQEYMSDEYAEIEMGLLTERNHKWIPIIMDLINKQPAFIAVGAAHLGGKNGLIHLLRKKGFKIKPLP